MQHVRQLDELNLNGQPSVVTIGVFDGLHRGHSHLIHTLVDHARSHGLLAGVMTFHPHPDEVIHGNMGRYYLTTVDERIEILSQWGVDYVVTHPFNPDVMQIPAQVFVERLVKHLHIKSLWVGADFALGHKREGNTDFLRERGASYGFTVQTLELLGDADTVISSTTIRNALRRGELSEARELLNRAYCVTGEVVHGEKRGRTIGFPTANIAVPDGKLIPANGVYAGWLTDENNQRHMAVTNVGYSPTFGNRAITVEAHILNFDRQIYGEQVTFTFEQYLRPEMRFQGVEALVAQLKVDVANARGYLSSQVS